MKTRNYSIDLLKFFLCLSVVIYHINYIFFWGIDDKTSLSPVFSFFFGIPFKGIFNGTFNVYVFCIISGYFAARKSITSIKELVVSCLKRYIVFFIPILLFNLVAFSFLKLNLYKHQEVSALLGNTWLSYYYRETVSFLEVIKQSLIFGTAVNQPLWMLPSLVLGNILIYCLSYVKSKINLIYLDFILPFILLPAVFYKSHYMIFYIAVVFATSTGILIKLLEEKISINKKTAWKIIAALIFLVSGNISVSNQTFQNCLYTGGGFLFVLLFIKSFYRENSCFFEKKFCELSFEIYIVHWPMILSVLISGLILKLSDGIPYGMLYLITVFAALPLILVSAFILHIISKRIVNLIN